MKKFFLYLFGFFALVVVVLVITGNSYVFKGIQLVYLKGRTTANIFDAPDFENNLIAKDTNTDELLKDSLYNHFPLTDSLQRTHKRLKTTAFVVLKEGKIIQEHYWNSDSITASNSFSMAKTLTTMLIQKAIEDGYINSWEEPFTNYVPEYANDALAQECTLADLSRMTSGFDWKEDYYFPINPTAKAYYDDDMDEVILSRKFVEKPNSSYKYLSGNTQLLGYVLQKGLNEKTISEYMSEKFWQPLGMNRDGLWTVDHEGGIEKTYCCVHTNARNFSKFGLLLMNNGNWQGKQLIDSAFVQKMITPYELSNGHYGYSVWTDIVHQPSFYSLRGHLGQYVMCIPEYDLVIVRLGELRDNTPHPFSDGYHPKDLYVYINETLKALKPIL